MNVANHSALRTGPAFPGSILEAAQNAFFPTEVPRWTPDDYRESLHGPAARWLSESSIAPLVEHARGYAVLDAATTADRLKEAEVKLSTTLGKAWKKQFQKRDGLFIPWHSLASLRDCLHKGNHPSHAESFVICAPEHLGEPERHNFTMKVGGSLGVHPSTPSSWIEKANVAVCVPSPMAADAWLTQSLFNSGISRDELARSGGQNPARRLTAIMEMVPFEDRVLVLSTDALALHRPSLPDDLAGAELPSEVLLVFDPQHASLTKAHQEASSVWEALEHNPSVSSPRALFLPPLVSRSVFPDGNLRPLLGSGARLDELISASVLEMPTAPSSNEETKPGAWRISEDGLRTEQCVQSARNDEAPTLRWEERIPLGGRITKLLTRRRPTTRELKTGRMDAPANGKVFINVEVSWEYRGSPEETCQVTGPKEILHYQPVDWIRHGAQIPTELLMHPNWPPRHQHAEGFLQAVKVHRRDERRESMVWQQMGWVPTAHGLPAFIAGEQVIPAHEDVTVEIKTPSPETSLLYGFGEISELNWKDAADVEQVRKDFRTILDTYVRSEAWSDPAAAAVILAGALRPCLPLRPKTSIYVWGPKGRGKTFSAETAMYFWASDKSAWIGKPPGSAGDTLAYTEKVLSSVPIWVIDDLAPSTSRDAAQNKSAHLEDTIRNVFNNAAKGRSDRDAQAQERNFPIAQLIITGENQLTTPSARERTIPVHIGTGSLHPDHKRTAAITELAASDGTQARFTSHVISYIRHLASTDSRFASGPGSGMTSWERMRSWLGEELRKHQKAAAECSSAVGMAAADRAGKLAGDLTVVYALLDDMAQYVNLGDEYRKILAFETGLPQRIRSLTMSTAADHAKASPGQALAQALGSALAAGYCHLIDGTDPAKAPESWHALGWTVGHNERPMPKGICVGRIYVHEGRSVALFDPISAFKVAEEKFPALIPPGQKGPSSWRSMWDEGLMAKGVTRQKELNTARLLSIKERPSGVPVAIDLLLNGGEPLES